VGHFSDRLAAAVQRQATPVMVGLDPRFESLPAALRGSIDAHDFQAVAKAYEQFCREVIAVVAPLVAVVKPQAAFFEQLGPPGMQALAKVIEAARAAGLIVILDGKRNDIGTTATAYAQAYLGAPPRSAWGADALTVSPYLGDDSLTPFVEVAQQNDAGIFVLVKTSNPGSGTFQDLIANDRRIHEYVADLVERLAESTVGESGFGLVNAVVGATYPQQLAELRQRMPHAWLLVPGFGAQGGAAQDVAGAFNREGLGAIINNSRGIIFAYQRPPFREQFGEARWQDAVAAATREMIAQLRADTLAGRLSRIS
jgi:orotidine-5'-phosphate decarboxylase